MFEKILVGLCNDSEKITSLTSFIVTDMIRDSKRDRPDLEIIKLNSIGITVTLILKKFPEKINGLPF